MPSVLPSGSTAMTETPGSSESNGSSGSGEGREEMSLLTLSESFEVLSLRRRRTILRCFAERPDDRVDFQDLVEAVSAHEADEGEPGDPTIEERARAPRRQRVAIGLHHDDLPRLAEAGLLEYDRWRGEVRYNRDDRIDALLARTVEDNEYDEHAQHDDHDREPYPPKL